MRKQTAILRRIFSALLLGGYLSVWLLWNLHPLLCHHHDHAEHPVCAHEAGTVHLHTEEYSYDECALCHFVPVFQEVVVLLLPDLAVDPQLIEQICLPTASPGLQVLRSFNPRGPPCF